MSYHEIGEDQLSAQHKGRLVSVDKENVCHIMDHIWPKMRNTLSIPPFSLFY